MKRVTKHFGVLVIALAIVGIGGGLVVRERNPSSACPRAICDRNSRCRNAAVPILSMYEAGICQSRFFRSRMASGWCPSASREHRKVATNRESLSLSTY